MIHRDSQSRPGFNVQEQMPDLLIYGVDDFEAARKKAEILVAKKNRRSGFIQPRYILVGVLIDRTPLRGADKRLMQRE